LAANVAQLPELVAKANPAPEVLSLLVALGSCFDIASIA
jgi:diaminopimelate decarboxylase